MISGKRLAIIIVVGILIIAAIVAGVLALIERRKNQIPEQVPAQKPNENTTKETESATDGETETGYEDIKKSENLKYTLNQDGNSYTVTGIGTCMDKDIVIPDTYKGKPVTAIGDGAFAGVSIETVTFSTSVTSIGSKVFVGCNDLELFFYGTKKEWISVTKADDWKEQCTVRVWPTVTEEDNWEIPIG